MASNSSSNSAASAPMSAESLTENLRAELEKTNQVFSRWADKKEEWLDQTSGEFQRTAEENYATVQALRESEAGLDRQKQINADRKVQLQQELEHNESQSSNLTARKEYMLDQLSHIMESRQREQAHHSALLQEHDLKRANLERAYNDLTQGIRNFSYLGLDLQKAPGNRMKFVFTQIDQNNPSREFFFQFFVDDADKYQMDECIPLIPAPTLQAILTTLNEDNDITRFTVCMRREFVKMV